MKKFNFYSLLFASLFCALAIQAHGQVVGVAPNNPTESQASVKLRGADGKIYDTASLRGQVVLVSFGATWCAPCRDELKALEQLKKEYKDKPVRIFWVSIEDLEAVSDHDLRDYAKRMKISFPVLRDPDKATFSRFSTRLRLPTILFFDKSGQLSTPNHVGMAEISLYLSTMRARLDRLLKMEAATNSTGR